MTVFKTKVVSPCIKIRADGTMDRSWALNRSINRIYWRSDVAPLANFAAHIEVAVHEKPCSLPKKARVFYCGWRHTMTTRRNELASALIEAASDEFRRKWGTMDAWGDALLQLHPGYSRRCIMVAKGHTLSDVEQWIDDNDLQGNFLGLEDDDLWIVQLHRDNSAMRQWLMMAKLRFS